MICEMETEEPKRRDHWWAAKMLAASAVLAGLLVFLAWAGLGLRLQYDEFRMEIDPDLVWQEWDLAAGSPNDYRDHYTGPYSQADFPPPQPDEMCAPLADWDIDGDSDDGDDGDDGPRYGAALARVYLRLKQALTDDDSDDPGDDVGLRILYDDRGLLMFRRNLDERLGAGASGEQ